MYQLRSDGIFMVTAVQTEGEHTPEQARANVEVIREMAAGKRHPMLLDIRVSAPMSRETRAIYNDAQRELVIAQAVVVGSTFSRINGNIFLRLMSPVHPMKLFTDPGAALAWLEDNFC